MWDTWAQSKSKSELKSKLAFVYLPDNCHFTQPLVPLVCDGSSVLFLESIVGSETCANPQLGSLKPSMSRLEGFTPANSWRGTICFVVLAVPHGLILLALSWVPCGKNRHRVNLGYPNRFLSIQVIYSLKMEFVINCLLFLDLIF